MSKVIPEKYSSLMQRLFISKILNALDPLGIRLDDVLIYVNPVGKDVFLRFQLRVVQTSLAGSIDVEPTVRGLIEKLTWDANESIGKVYGVTFVIDGIDVEQELPKKQEKPQSKPKLVLNAPAEVEEQLRRIGKGLAISLKEWRIPAASLTLSVDSSSPDRLSVVVKLEETLEGREKEHLVKALRGKLLGYVRLLIKRPMYVSVRILDPSDKLVARARAIKKARVAEKEVEKIIGDEDIKAIMKALGKL